MTAQNLISEARRLAGKATQGVWEWREDEMIARQTDTCSVAVIRVYDNEGGASFDLEVDEPDRVFIARSRSLVPALADALEAAMKENKRLNDLLEDRDWKLNHQAEILGRMEAEDVENHIRIKELDDENARLKYLMSEKEQEARDD